jgi:hypothetical protein
MKPSSKNMSIGEHQSIYKPNVLLITQTILHIDLNLDDDDDYDYDDDDDDVYRYSCHYS